MSGLCTRAFLQTRGTARAGDYTFLGSAPEEPWWRAYRDATAFDHPTVLVTSDGVQWAAYLSGIPSARVDAVGTVVRYTLVLDGPCGSAETGCVVAGVAAWLDDVAAGPDRSGGRLSAALDAGFPADLVDGMVTRPFPGGVHGDDGAHGPTVPVLRYCTDATVVASGVLRALASLPVPSPPVDERGEWLGAVAVPACRAALVARVAALVDGTPGRALLLNLVGGPDDVTPLLDAASPVAVLADGAVPVTPLRSEVDAKKAPVLPRRAGVAVITGAAMPPVLATAVVLAALVVLTLVLLL